MFCSKCGNKLDEAAAPVSSLTSHPKCVKCNTVNNSGAVFCKGCGNKL